MGSTTTKNVERNIKELNERIIFNEVVGVKEDHSEVLNQGENNLIHLNQPLWQIKIKDLRLSDKSVNIFQLLPMKTLGDILKVDFSQG